VIPETEPDGQLDSAALLKAAATAGRPVSARLLTLFRSQGLVPHPRRAGYKGRAPVWLYPHGTDRQLVALLEHRVQTRDPDLLRVLLWLDGFTIATGDVRRALITHLKRVREAIEQAVTAETTARLGLDPADPAARDQAVSALAGVMAAKRGTSPIPRHGRVPARERAEGVELLIRSIGLGEQVEGTPAQGAAVERTLGITPGRRRSPVTGQPWLTGPAEEFFGAAGIVSVPRLLESAASASDEELEAGRRSVIALVRLLPLAARMTDVLSGRDNTIGLSSLEQVTSHPEIIMWLLPAVVSMTKAGAADTISALTDALEPFPGLAARAQALTDLPAATVAKNLENKSAEERQRVMRVIDAAIDGRLS
jgi:hypothetical protein